MPRGSRSRRGRTPGRVGHRPGRPGAAAARRAGPALDVPRAAHGGARRSLSRRRLPAAGPAAVHRRRSVRGAHAGRRRRRGARRPGLGARSRGRSLLGRPSAPARPGRDPAANRRCPRDRPARRCRRRRRGRVRCGDVPAHPAAAIVARAEELDKRAMEGRRHRRRLAESLAIFWPAYFAEPASRAARSPTGLLGRGLRRHVRLGARRAAGPGRTARRARRAHAVRPRRRQPDARHRLDRHGRGDRFRRVRRGDRGRRPLSRGTSGRGRCARPLDRLVAAT